MRCSDCKPYHAITFGCQICPGNLPGTLKGKRGKLRALKLLTTSLSRLQRPGMNVTATQLRRPEESFFFSKEKMTLPEGGWAGARWPKCYCEILKFRPTAE